MSKLKNFLYEDASIEEAMAISAGGTSLAPSNQISGGMQLPLGMKPGQKVKRRKKGTVITASPALHDPDALALQETEDDIQESFGVMHKPDFEGPAMRGLWRGLEDPEKPVKTGSPELDKDIEDHSE